LLGTSLYFVQALTIIAGTINVRINFICMTDASVWINMISGRNEILRVYY